MVSISRPGDRKPAAPFVSLAIRGGRECSDLTYPPTIISLISDQIVKYFEGVEQPDIEAAESLSALV